jgi:hypothetical protein
MWKSGFKSILVKPKIYTCGTLKETEPEIALDQLKFKVYKYNARPRPPQNHTVVFSCFSEFGSELIGTLYCIPNMLQDNYLGYYSIAMGWYGREYLYRHLVDEFWELGEEYQWLREYCRAFHHESRNLKKLEKAIKPFGKLIDSGPFGNLTVNTLYQNLALTKKRVCWTPPPSDEAYQSIQKYLKPNSVGVVARYRQCYGRNLDLDFYKKLLDSLEAKGYNPIWIGEHGTTYECPYSHITNFRDAPEARDLEKTLALISKLQFTIQFWTASTRLAGLVGTPFIIFESPDQIYGVGHEGIRLNLCTRGKKKIVISHFHSVNDDHTAGLKLVDQAIDEMKVGNWEDIIGLVESQEAIAFLQKDNLIRIGGKT